MILVWLIACLLMSPCQTIRVLKTSEDIDKFQDGSGARLIYKHGQDVKLVDVVDCGVKPVDVVGCGSFDWTASGVLLSPPDLHLKTRQK